VPEFIDPKLRMRYLPASRAGDYQHYHWTGAKHSAPREVEAFFSLSPNAQIVLDVEHVGLPVAFLSGFIGNHPGREHLVVSRDWGDLTWPAWLEGQRTQAPAHHARYLKELIAPIRAAIIASAKKIERTRPLEREHRYA